jgi:hypothetical protein
VYENDAELSSLPVNARFPTQWHDVLGITSDELIIYNVDHTIFRKITADAWRDYNTLAGNKKGIDLVTAVVNGEPASTACFLAAHLASAGEFWNALRDNCQEEIMQIFARAGLDSSEANFKVWRTGYSGGIRSVSARGAHFNEGYMWNGKEALLPLPAETEWFIETGGVPSS